MGLSSLWDNLRLISPIGHTLIPEAPAYMVTMYQQFDQQVARPHSVLYPCCGKDKSPSEVFSRVTYLDNDISSIRGLRREGLDAQLVDVTKYVPSKLHDLVITLNPQIPGSILSKLIDANSYVIANDFHGTASQLSELENFSVIAAYTGSTFVLDNKESLNQRMIKPEDGIYAHLEIDSVLSFDASFFVLKNMSKR